MMNFLRGLWRTVAGDPSPDRMDASAPAEPLRLAFPEDVANAPWTRDNARVTYEFLNSESGALLMRILTATVVSRSLVTRERTAFEQGKTAGMALMLRELWESGRIDRERWEGGPSDAVADDDLQDI